MENLEARGQAHQVAKYAQIWRNSVLSKGTASVRVSLVKDRATVEGAVDLGGPVVKWIMGF